MLEASKSLTFKLNSQYLNNSEVHEKKKDKVKSFPVLTLEFVYKLSVCVVRLDPLPFHHLIL
ncbi:hypothetical protein BJP37_07650 [Moorena bouillonii PNG]|uniref:Uncharacterized protein n=1 Tax=Moorena bouillonii PNG TaxID=568701 RepID=A0A1U7MZ50_9CYAN|nr:hypothetical protein BJP37_07650 [Moorena bouillonii PNG]